MKIGLYEHVSGGGLAGGPISSSLLSEGYGMLGSLSSDLKAANHYVTVLLDSRVNKFHPCLKADCIVEVVSKSQFEESLKVDGVFDAFYVIAPESNNLLCSLVEEVELSNLKSLNCRAKTIALTNDKAKLYSRLNDLYVKTPKTIFCDLGVDPNEVACEIEGVFGFPAVFKPSSGAGCGGLSIVKNRLQIAKAMEKIGKASPEGKVVVQEFVAGSAASVSLIVTEKKALPVSLNRQNVVLEEPEGFSSYDGGEVPLDSPLREQAFDVAKRVVESFGGLRGYVGVDLILGDKSVCVVEINPRLTTSYVGLRKVASFNVGQAIVDAVVKDELPADVQIKGCSLFSKVAFSGLETNCLAATYGMNAVVSPPFPVDEGVSAFGLIEANAATRGQALRKLDHAKKKIQRIKCSRRFSYV